MRLLPYLLCPLASALAAQVAFACSTNSPAEFEVRGDPSDDTPPAAPIARIERVKRGEPPKQEGCSQAVSSCDDIAYVLIDVTGAPESDVGYVLEVSGHAPEGIAGLAGRPIAPHGFEPGKLRLHWQDGEGEKNYDFRLEIWAVDRAGNMSETSTQLRVDNDGSDGCSAHAGRAQAGWLAALCALLLARRQSMCRA